MYVCVCGGGGVVVVFYICFLLFVSFLFVAMFFVFVLLLLLFFLLLCVWGGGGVAGRSYNDPDTPLYYPIQLRPLYHKIYYTKCIHMQEQYFRHDGPRREKTCLRGLANNKCADQPAHPRSLISAFAFRLLKRIISKLAPSKI